MSEWFLTYGFADVYDRLLIGAFPLDAPDVQLLARAGIRHVLNLAQESEYPSGQHERVAGALAAAGIDEVRIDLEDHGALPQPALDAAVEQTVAWLQAGDPTYLHCRAGWQRSAAVAAGVVAILDGVDIEVALDRVRTRKPSARPLPHQRQDLLSWWAQRGEGGAGGSDAAAPAPDGA